MEIRFCSICNESIPDGEFDAGRAIVSGSGNKKSQHVACALKRSMEMSGTRSWLTFLLALYAAAVATYFLVAGPSREEDPKHVPEAVAARIALVEAETTEHLTAVGKQQNANLKAQMQEALAAADGHREKIHDALSAHVLRYEKQEAMLVERFKSLEGRQAQVEGDLSRVRDWMLQIKDLANEVARLREDVAARDAAAAARPPEPQPPVEPGPEPPAEGPRDDPEHDAEVTRWIERLDDSNNDLVFTATVRLAELKDLRAAKPLVAVLAKHKDFYARLGAATALGEIKAVDGVLALVDSLNDKDDLVRTAANEALFAITDTDFGFSSKMGSNERKKVQRKWRTWFKENEAPLRARLNQP